MLVVLPRPKYNNMHHPTSLFAPAMSSNTSIDTVLNFLRAWDPQLSDVETVQSCIDWLDEVGARCLQLPGNP